MGQAVGLVRINDADAAWKTGTASMEAVVNFAVSGLPGTGLNTEAAKMNTNIHCPTACMKSSAGYNAQMTK
jgi:hypothetical protein